MLRDLPSVVLVVGLIPLLWSAAVWALCGAGRARAHVASMRLEAAVLALMIAPAIAGGALLLAVRFAPEAPLPVFDLPELGWGDRAAPAVYAGVTTKPAAPSPSSWPALALIAAYLAGVLLGAARLLRARARLDGIADASVAAPEVGPDVRLTDESAPAFATARGMIILPRALTDRLPLRDLALVVAHERAHVDRRDPRSFWALAWVDVIFWPNPFVRSQSARCRLAAELACDAAALQGALQERAAYARALVAAAKHAAGAPAWAPTIFTTHSRGECQMRLTRIMSAAPGRRGAGARAALAGTALLAAPVMALQVGCVAQQAAPDPAMFSTLPVQSARITSEFGQRIDPVTRRAAVHLGLDFAAYHGAPIYAPADGRVTFTGWRGGYGLVVEMDHGGGVKTRSAHLHDYEVTKGDRVTAGQVIGRMGSTGRSTGDHLHWELWHRGKVYDPMPVLASLGFTDAPRTPAADAPAAAADASAAADAPDAVGGR